MNQKTKNDLFDLTMRVLPGAIFAVVGFLWTQEAQKRDKAHEEFTKQLAGLADRIEAIDTRVDQHAIDLAVIRATSPQGQ